MFVENYLKDAAPWLLTEYYKQDLWVWLSLPILFISAFALSSLITHLAMIAARTASYRRTHIFERYISPLHAPVRLWLGIVLFAASSHLLPLSKATQNGLKYLIGGIAIYAIIWGLFLLVTSSSEALRLRFIARGKVSAASLIPLMRKLLKAFLVAVALLFLLQNWGFDVAAILAGLGIGGIAIALASQKSVENLFGGVSVTLDQPVRIGDFIRFGEFTGTVEDIGLRSTVIRTTARTLVTVPNSQFSEMQLENFAARDKILMLKTIALRYDTTPEQIRSIVSRITEYLASREDTDEGARARFVNMSDFSLDIEVFVYILTSDFNLFLKAQEEIYLDIMEIVHTAGTDFAFPTSSIYLEKTQNAVQTKQAA